MRGMPVANRRYSRLSVGATLAAAKFAKKAVFRLFRLFCQFRRFRLLTAKFRLTMACDQGLPGVVELQSCQVE